MPSRCAVCRETFATVQDLLGHQKITGHGLRLVVPERKVKTWRR